jgi:hypothetical protein
MNHLNGRAFPFPHSAFHESYNRSFSYKLEQDFYHSVMRPDESLARDFEPWAHIRGWQFPKSLKWRCDSYSFSEGRQAEILVSLVCLYTTFSPPLQLHILVPLHSFLPQLLCCFLPCYNHSPALATFFVISNTQHQD